MQSNVSSRWGEGEGRTRMRRMRSVKLTFMEKTSVLAGVLVDGSLDRILYLLHDSECRMRTRSSSGRFARSRISLNVSLSSAQRMPFVRYGTTFQTRCRTASLGCEPPPSLAGWRIHKACRVFPAQ